MAKISNETREMFNEKIKPYRDRIATSLEKEKSILNLIEKDSSGTAYKRLLLAEEMISVATLYMTINNLSVQLLETKNNDALNDARKILYKAIIYLEEIVTNFVDTPYSDLEAKLSEISNAPLEKRYFLIRKLGLAIKLLVDGFGDNTKWKWSFVEMQGRFATVCKNMIDMKQAGKDYFDPRSPDYDTTVFYIRLVRRLLNQSAGQYRDRYELSTHRIDDIRLAINFLVALRRLCLIINEKEEAEEIKKKALVWKEKMDSDQKSGTAN
jgi:hypothetical protein